MVCDVCVYLQGVGVVAETLPRWVSQTTRNWSSGVCVLGVVGVGVRVVAAEEEQQEQQQLLLRER